MAYTKNQDPWVDSPATSSGLILAADVNAWESALYQQSRSRRFHYVIYADGGTIYAKSNQSGLSDYSGAEPGAVLQSAITAVGVNGGDICLAGAFAWGSVPSVPRSISGRLRIYGNGQTTITLSSAGPRFLDFHKIADGDTFQNLEIDGITVDCGGVGGNNHTLIGTFVAGTWTSKINIDRVTVRRCRIFNAPTSSTVGSVLRYGIALGVNNALADSQNTITNIVIEDLDMADGDQMILIEGVPGPDPTANVLCDNIRVNRWRHVFSSAPIAAASGAHMVIGGKGYGGSCVISNGYGRYSTDVGIEVDSMENALVENCVVEDAYDYDFFHINYTDRVTTNPQSQITFRNCVAATRTVADHSCGWKIIPVSANLPSNTSLIGCRYYRSVAGVTLQYEAIDINGPQRVLIDDMQQYIVAGTYSGAGNQFPFLNRIRSSATTARTNVEIRNMYVKASCTRSGSGTVTFRGMMLRTGTVVFDIDGFTADLTVVGGAAGCAQAIDIGDTSGAAFIDGEIRNCWFLTSGDSTPNAIVVEGSGNNTMGRVVIHDNNFAWMGGSSTAAQTILFQGTSNIANVLMYANKWKVPPVPSALTALVSTTGKALSTGWKALAVFTQGSGSGITALDFSTNTGTTYTNFLTQGSGALPAGFDQALGPLTPDSLIKATFSTTQPTITLVPFDP